MIKILFETGIAQGRWGRFDVDGLLIEEGTFQSFLQLEELIQQFQGESCSAVFAGIQVSLASVDMPIKQVRQIVKALPFAIEEQLASDLSTNHLIYLGKEGGKAQAAITEIDYMEALAQHSQLRSLYSLLLLLPTSASAWTVFQTAELAFVKQSDHTGFVCPAPQLPLFLDLAKNKSGSESVEIQLIRESDQDVSLLMAQLETSGYQVSVSEIPNIWTLLQNVNHALPHNLLVGDFKPAQIKKNKRPSVLTGVIGLAASVFALGVMMNIWQGKTQAQLAEQVRAATESYYSTLFPGESMPKLTRQIVKKFDVGSGSGGDSFTHTLGAIGEPLKAQSELQSIVLHNIRFNEKRGGYEFELTAASISQLENYKKALSERGFAVEITSATNESAGIKGQIKVKRNG